MVIVDTSELVLGPPRGTDTILQPPEGRVLRGDGVRSGTPGMLAETNTTAIALLVLGGLLAILSIVALVLRHRSKGEGPEIPSAMRPGPSDTALETPVLQRLQGWGLVMVVFMVAWFPLQWLLEPGPEPDAGGRAEDRSPSSGASWPCCRSPRRTSSASGACGATAPS